MEKYAEIFEVDLGALVSRDLWLGEESQLVEDVGIPYGSKRLEREKEALHGMLDEKEQTEAAIRRELAALIKEMRAADEKSPFFGRILELRKLLEG